MGYDVTYHPINENEIKEWYFNRLREIGQNDFEKARQLIQKFAIKDFYADKYLTTLRAGVTSLAKGNEPFDKTHGFYTAVTQGFFRTFFYTRGAAFSFLTDEYREFQDYTKPWQEILATEITYP